MSLMQIDSKADEVMLMLIRIPEFEKWGRHVDGLGRISDPGSVLSLAVCWLTSERRRIEMIEEFSNSWIVAVRRLDSQIFTFQRGRSLLHAMLLAVNDQHGRKAAAEAVAMYPRDPDNHWMKGRSSC